ncbi:5'-deoxynucleotidase [Celerinatantimonas sp. YJH-8]|uniref:5'-deoxynucleotidase n=1 Tax=Celerinatantimonas sp. YJH-8 TaxID=3228714 RepID=UPI0038C00CC2
MSYKATQQSHFIAQLARMKLIERWPLMRSQQRENIAEHSLMVAMIAHLLVVIENHYFDGQLDPGQAVMQALYHDSSEVLTGDLPTPVKYANHELRDAYHALEAQAEQRLLSLLPAELQPDYQSLLVHHNTSHYATIVKDADVLSAYIKCKEEMSSGNLEFASAERKLQQTLQERSRPALDYFIHVFVDSTSLTLDDLSQWD